MSKNLRNNEGQTDANQGLLGLLSLRFLCTTAWRDWLRALRKWDEAWFPLLQPGPCTSQQVTVPLTTSQAYQSHLLKIKCKSFPSVETLNRETANSQGTWTHRQPKSDTPSKPSPNIYEFLISEIHIRGNSWSPFLSGLHKSLESAYFLLWPVVILIGHLQTEAAQMSQYCVLWKALGMGVYMLPGIWTPRLQGRKSWPWGQRIF